MNYQYTLKWKINGAGMATSVKKTEACCWPLSDRLWKLEEENNMEQYLFCNNCQICYKGRAFQCATSSRFRREAISAIWGKKKKKKRESAKLKLIILIKFKIREKAVSLLALWYKE